MAKTNSDLKTIKYELDTFFELSVSLFCIANFDGYFVKLNPIWERILGFSNDELTAKPFIEFVHPEDREKTIAEVQNLSSGKNTISFENRYLCKDGSYITLLWNATSSIEHRLIYATAANITERVNSDTKIRESEQRSQALFENSPAAIVVVGKFGNIVLFNKTAEKLFGYRREEIIGQSVDILVPNQYRGSHADRRNDYNKSPETRRMGVGRDIQGRKKDGTEFFVEIGLNSIQTNDGPLTMAFIIDITERKTSQNKLKSTLENLSDHALKLEIVNKEMEAFSYSVSHDLRAPLRSIDGFSQALLEDYADKLDDTGNDYLRRVRSATQKMGRLIDDMLQLSRVTRSDMNRRQVDLTALAHAVMKDLKERYPQRSVDVIIEQNLTAEGDQGLLRVVLDNLLNNAWKYTSKKKHARIQFSSLKGDGAQTFFVRDDGFGFDMAFAHKLFGAFQRLHGVDEFEGTGIGLATVQRIVHRHGGQVWAEGQVDSGATFFFTLNPFNSIGEDHDRKDNSAGRGQPRRCAVDPART